MLLTPAIPPIDRTLHGQALVADRPDFTEATSTVGLGVLQFEFGYTFGVDDEGRTITRAHSFGEPLVRAGVLADRLELRLGAGSVTEATESSGRTTTEAGLEDVYLGVKLALSGQRGIFPATAILPQTTIPTGAEAFSAGRALPGVNFLYAFVPRGLDVPAEHAPERTEHYFNSGLAWLATEDLQWDVRVGLGVNDAAEDVYVGAGVVWRVGPLHERREQ